MVRHLVILGTVLAGCVLPASAETPGVTQSMTPQGPAAQVIEKWFLTNSAITCYDAKGNDGPCARDRIDGFRVFYDQAGHRALAFANWSPDTGNATNLAVGYFKKSDVDWTFERNLEEVYGQIPDAVDFSSGRASFTMTALMPDDSRCCPTGTQRYDVALATGTVLAGPKIGPAGPVAKVALQAAPAPKAGEISGRPWMHNGSTMVLDWDEGTLVYNIPKPSIRSVVRPGTVLFRGSLAPGRIVGTAYAFKDGCAPAPYPVRGTYSDGGYTLTLRGMGPVRSGCDVVSYSERSPHAVLKFFDALDN